MTPTPRLTARSRTVFDANVTCYFMLDRAMEGPACRACR